MGRFEGIRRWFHLDRAVADEIDDELGFHFQQTVEELVAKGYSPDGARAEVHRRFGNLAYYREALRRIDQDRRLRRQRADWLELFGRSLAHAWRSLWRRPSFTVLVALTLGLGIGVNAAMFGVLDRLMIRPPALVRDPDAVRRIYVRRGFLGRQTVTSSLTYGDIRDLEQAHGFSGVSVVHDGTLTYGGGPVARKIAVNLVGTGFFSLLGVRPALGRAFIPADDSLPSGAGVAVISHGFWRREFGGISRVLGQVLNLGEGRYRIVGVTPEGFTGAGPERVDVWLPVRPAAAEIVSGPWETSRGIYWLGAIARLTPGSSLERVEAEATALHRAGRADDKHYDPNASVITGPLLEALGPLTPPEAKVSLWIAGVSLVVLLIACANVANLLLFRAIRRRRETAVRLALGIGRTRLIGELMVETVLLAVVAGAGATLFAMWGSEAIRRLLFPELDWPAGMFSWRIAGFTLLITLLAGLTAGLVPAWLESRPDLLSALKESGAQSGTRRSLLRGGLVVVQAGLSVALLVGAGLFLVSFQRVRSLDLGMRPQRVLLVTPEFPGGTPDARVTEIHEAALARLGALPGVERASYSSAVPFRSNWAEDLQVPGIDSIPRIRTGGPYVDGVSPDYFTTLGIPIVRGRGFTAGDRPGAARVTVVGETMAHMLWPGQEALGKCLKVGGDTMPCSEVVGVARDARRNSFAAGDRMQYYVPLVQFPGMWPQALFLRTAGDPSQLMEPVRRALAELAPELRWVSLEPLQALVDPEYRSWRLGATLFTAFGALALLVSGIGLYSLLSYGVASRTREIGVRSALGARPGGIMVLVARDGLGLVLAGLVMGTMVALAVARAMGPLLFRTSPLEPEIYVAVSLVLLLIGVGASALPAWRATRVSPITALRSE
jgi:putative ABC transport system permease protein